MIKLVALKFLHFFITIGQIAFSACIWLHCLFKDVRASAFGGQNVTLYSVRLDARYLTKIPDHLALVVGEEAISYSDLVSGRNFELVNVIGEGVELKGQSVILPNLNSLQILTRPI